MTADELISETREALDRLPDTGGGIALALATSSTPPAMAMLSTGDVHWAGDRLRVGIYASSSVIPRLGGAFTLLVPLRDRACRIEVVEATARVAGPIAMLEGRVGDVRPTAEPPWLVEMRFRPEPAGDPRLQGFVDYWAGVRSWLSGETDEAPQPPG